MYKIISNRAVTYSCTCPMCNSYFLFTQSELRYDDAFSEDAYFECPCCGVVLVENKATILDHRDSTYHFNEAVI